MKISIIIPIYNSERYINKCISSVVTQTYKKIEIILVDDGSTDASGIICEEWKKKDSRVIVMHQKNGGSSCARNAGMQLSTGDYIAFLDSDDYWYSNLVLEKIVNRLKITSPDVLSFNYVKLVNTKFKKPYFNNVDDMPHDSNEIQSRNYIFKKNLWVSSAWNKIVKSKIIKSNDLYFLEGITSEDIDWNLRLALYSKKFDYFNEIVVVYLQRNNSISNSITLEKELCLFNNIKRCLKLVENKKISCYFEYIAYQYGTLLYGVSKLEDTCDKKELILQLKNYRYLLNYSKNKKIILLRIINKLLGFDMIIKLLKYR